MNLKYFQLVDNDPLDNSINKRGYLKVYHQQGGLLKNPYQNTELIWGGCNNYHQNGNSYLEYDIPLRDPTAPFTNKAEIRLVNNAFAYCFKETVLWTTGGTELEHIKFLGRVLTIMRSSTNKDGDLFPYFDNINEEGTNNYSLNDRLNKNHTVEVNSEK